MYFGAIFTKAKLNALATLFGSDVSSLFPTVKGNVLLHILSFNERVQMVPVDSWIVNAVTNCSFEEIGFRRSDFIACYVSAYFIQTCLFYTDQVKRTWQT